VHVATLRWMRGLLKRARPRAPDVAAVREVDAASLAEPARNRGEIDVGVRCKRSGTEGDPVRGVVYEGHHALERRAVRDDARQAEDGPGRIVRMQRHADTRLRGHRNDALEEVAEVVPELARPNGAIGSQQRLKLIRTVGR